MRLHPALGLVAFTLIELVDPSLAAAATAVCMSPDGSCEVNNVPVDFTDCVCADGSGMGGGGGNDWAGLTELELQPICEEQLAAFCGPPLPPDGIQCMSPIGACEIDNDPFDSIFCECADGSAGGGGGGNVWAGYSDADLLAECEAQIDLFCAPPPPPMGIPCGTVNGDCTISNVPEDFIECECTDGSGFGFGGGMGWAGLSDMELVMVCEEIVDLECGGAPPPPPPPPALECSSRLGACAISNDPLDFLECNCAEGDGFVGGGGMEWAGLSDEELLMVCEAELAEGCAVGESETTGEPGDTEGETGGSSGGQASTGGEGLDTGGASEGSTGTEPDDGTTSGTTTAGGDTDETGGAADGGGGGGGCSVASPAGPTWGLVLLGLLGLNRRRRRAA